jgi:hypothetical protein
MYRLRRPNIYQIRIYPLFGFSLFVIHGNSITVSHAFFISIVPAFKSARDYAARSIGSLHEFFRLDFQSSTPHSQLPSRSQRCHQCLRQNEAYEQEPDESFCVRNRGFITGYFSARFCINTRAYRSVFHKPSMRFSTKVLFTLVATFCPANAAPVRHLRTLPAVSDEVLPTVQLEARSLTGGLTSLAEVAAAIAPNSKRRKNYSPQTPAISQEPPIFDNDNYSSNLHTSSLYSPQTPAISQEPPVFDNDNSSSNLHTSSFKAC